MTRWPRSPLSRPRRTRRLAGLSAMVVAALAMSLLVATPAQARGNDGDIYVTVTNASDQAMVLRNLAIAGCWVTGHQPPSRIEVDEQVVIWSQPCGGDWETEILAQYQQERTGLEVRLHYSNPLVGSDTFDERAPEGYRWDKGGILENRVSTLRCDSACDGIPLAWKQGGVTIDPGDGQPAQHADLPAMGVSLDRPNVLVQLDWMEDTSHVQQLRQTAIDEVIAAYDQAPVLYRGATRPGITLIVDAGPDSTLHPGGAK